MQSKAEKRQLLNELLTQAEKICKTNIFKAQSLGRPAYDLAEELGDQNAMAKAVYFLCIGFCQGRRDHSIELIHKALQMIDPSEEVFLVRFYNLLGLNETNNGCHSMAMEYYTRAFELAEKMDSVSLIFMLLNNFGELFRAVGDERRALAYYQEAYSLIEDKNDTVPERFFTCLLDNLVISHSILGEFEQARCYIEILEDIHAGGKTDTTWFKHAKGCYYKALGAYKEAIRYFETFIEITKEYDAIELRISAFKDLGDCHAALDQNYQAVEAYNLGCKLAQENEDRESSIYCISQMAEISQKMGKKDQALEWFSELNHHVFTWTNLRKDMHSDYLMHKMTFSQLKKAKRYVEEEHRQVLKGHETIQTAYKRLDLAVDIGNALKSNPSLKSLLSILNRQIRRLMSVSSIGIARYNRELDQLNLIYIIEDGTVKDDLYFDLSRPETFNLKTCLRERSSVVFRNREEDFSDRLSDYKFQNAYDDIQSAMYVPIIAEDVVKGVLTVQCKEINAYNEEDLKLLEVISAFFSQINFCDDRL